MTNLNLSGDTATVKAPRKDDSYQQINPGPYIGIVKQNVDPEKMGRLGVLIPSIVKDIKATAGQLVICEYLSPFYGSKSVAVTDGSDPHDYSKTQHSYGMWAIPPDLDSRVLVIFAEGKISNAFWIGCIQDAYTNHMIPGIAASEKTMPQDIKGGPHAGLSKESLYGTDFVPAGELNRNAWNTNGGSYDKVSKPIHPFAETLRKQGLIQDVDRGTTSSSARRETPSNVFGISTPGPVDTSAEVVAQGPTDKLKEKQVNRLPGHTFVMDDGDVDGDNQLIRLRTSSGHQILLHDTEGVVYIANGSGEAWMQFAENGAIDIYAGSGLSIRSKNNMNFHSDANISMYAGGQIKLKSQGNISLDGMMINEHSNLGIKLYAKAGAITTKAETGPITSYALAGQQHHTAGSFHLAGSTVHHNTIFPNPGIAPSLTGLLVVPVGDVDTSNKGKREPLKFEQGLNQSMNGMRVPTHEPFEEHFGLKHGLTEFVSTGSHPWKGKFSSWMSLASTVGTVEHLQQLNRTSNYATAKLGQFTSDLKEHINFNNLSKTIDVSKLTKVANNFTKNYSKLYKLPITKNPHLDFAIAPLNKNISSIVKETISQIKGDTNNLFKNSVFANASGIISVEGDLSQKISTDFKSIVKDLTSIKNSGVTTTGNVLGDIHSPHIGGYVQNSSTGSNIIKNVNKTKKVYKSIVGDKVVSVTQIDTIKNSFNKKIASVKRSIGKVFDW